MPAVFALTSPVLAWFLTLTCLGGLGGAVLLLGRIVGHGTRAVLGRTGVLLGSILAVLLTSAVHLNDQFLFFAGWRDLFSIVSGSPTQTLVQRGAGARSAVTAAVPGHPTATATPLPTAPLPLPTGQTVQPGVVSYQVTGPRSGVTTGVQVVLPPGYDAKDTTTYPVIETFTGYPASVNQWVKVMGLREQVDAAAQAHRILPMILVSPQLEIPPGTDTECVDGPAGSPQMETFLTEDVPEWVSAHFRVTPGRQAWATMGLSSGGWCAAMAGLLHPQQYGAVISMGGYFRPVFEAGYEPFSSSSPAGLRYDLVALARRNPPPVAVWMQTSHADPMSYGTSAPFITQTRAPLSLTAVVLQNAGHRVGVWAGLIPQALQWLGAAMPGFAP